MNKINNKKDNGKLPGWAIILIILVGVIPSILFIVLFGFLIFSEELNDDLDDIKPVSVISTYDEYNKTYIVSGYITNNLDEDYYDLEIKYALYDINNNIIGYATDYLEELDDGKIWKFSCEYYGIDSKEVYRVELKEITGW